MQSCGLKIASKHTIDSEWREFMLENGDGWIVEDALRLARMRRREEALVREFGRPRYEAFFASSLWGVYQMLGKLCPTVYILKKQ
jgi:hypothetical protein